MAGRSLNTGDWHSSSIGAAPLLVDEIEVLLEARMTLAAGLSPKGTSSRFEAAKVILMQRFDSAWSRDDSGGRWQQSFSFYSHFHTTRVLYTLGVYEARSPPLPYNFNNM